MEKAERIKESLEKALKQEETNCGKCKREENHVTFSKDDAIVEEETQEVNDDIYLSELDQLSLNDADLEADLNDLEELEPGEISE
jgi:phage-related protein